MKTRRSALLGPLTVLALLWAEPLARAYYDPGVQRWINRDPLGEKGFETVRRPREIDMHDGVNLYSFVLNDPWDNIDSNGLTLWLCSRKSTGFPGVGNHVYFWDDSGALGPGKSCGMSGSSGKGTPGNPPHDTGPGTPGQDCVAIPTSQDPMYAKGIWDCCEKNANTGVWKPWGNDCHNKVDDCLTPFGIEPPKHPRLGHPRVIPTRGSSAPPPVFSPL
jgi:RHS repeat-associated protein